MISHFLTSLSYFVSRSDILSSCKTMSSSCPHFHADNAIFMWVYVCVLMLYRYGFEVLDSRTSLLHLVHISLYRPRLGLRLPPSYETTTASGLHHFRIVTWDDVLIVLNLFYAWGLQVWHYCFTGEIMSSLIFNASWCHSKTTCCSWSLHASVSSLALLSHAVAWEVQLLTCNDKSHITVE